MTLITGQLLRLRAFGGQIIERTLVRVEGEFAVVTTSEEWDASKKEEREPISIGFPLGDVVTKEGASPND